MYTSKMLIGFLIFFIAATLFSVKLEAKVMDTKNWTTEASLKTSEIEIQNDNQNLYILPIDKDIVRLSKKNDLSDIKMRYLIY